MRASPAPTPRRRAPVVVPRPSLASPPASPRPWSPGGIAAGGRPSRARACSTSISNNHRHELAHVPRSQGCRFVPPPRRRVALAGPAQPAGTSTAPTSWWMPRRHGGRPGGPSGGPASRSSSRQPFLDSVELCGGGEWEGGLVARTPVAAGLLRRRSRRRVLVRGVVAVHTAAQGTQTWATARQGIRGPSTHHQRDPQHPQHQRQHSAEDVALWCRGSVQQCRGEAHFTCRQELPWRPPLTTRHTPTRVVPATRHPSPSPSH